MHTIVHTYKPPRLSPPINIYDNLLDHKYENNNFITVISFNTVFFNSRIDLRNSLWLDREYIREDKKNNFFLNLKQYL